MKWLSELKYRIADTLFEKELDEAFTLGIIQGKNQLASILRVELEYREHRMKQLKVTKPQAVGYEKAMELVKEIIK
jgi:hypothetical protein